MATVKGETTSDPTESYVSQSQLQDELKEANKGIREDFMLIFGIFATLLIFLSIEVQIIQKADRFSELVGFSLFLLAAILSFLFLLMDILKNPEVKTQKQLAVRIKQLKNNPIVIFIGLCFIGAIICFAWAAFRRTPH